MKKIIISIFMIMFLFSTEGFSTQKALTDEQCDKIIKAYKIDPEIKSKRGWLNVFKSDQWKKKFLLDGYTESELACIYDYILANAMVVKKYSNYVGVEMKI